MSDTTSYPATGRCNCGDIQYRLLREPLFVHCCHCTWCQRETGSAFVLNAMVETASVELTSGTPARSERPSASGIGQQVYSCPRCEVPLWSHFGGREQIAFVRVATLENPALCPPDIHIFTTTRQPWVKLDDSVPVMDEFYRRSEFWPEAAYQRYQQALES
ncbi:GFA family protein [Haliea sp. E17]|uniref:GFA family protein n=1 Tax=Haliea sp. E17 TaxID=3401576 RepID=UPI003AB0558D